MAQATMASLQLQSCTLSSTGSQVPVRKAILGSDSAALLIPVGRNSCSPATTLQVRAESKEVKASERRPAQLAAAAAVAGLLGVPGSASAVEAEAVTSVLNQVEDVVQQVSEKAVLSYGVVRNVLEQVVEASKPVVEAATPVVQAAAKKAYEAAIPLASDLADKAKQALNDAGVDTAPVLQAAKTAAEVTGSLSQTTGRALTEATPGAQSTLQTVLSQDPAILAAGAGALGLLYLLAPSIGSAVAYSARGFAGELTAAQTLDLLSSQDYTLIDVRTEKERAKSGTPSLPRSAQKKRYSIPVEELPSKLRGQLRNARKVEAELTAIKIASLKKLGKGSKIAILDANGGIAKLVARSLSALGFRNTFVVKDGTDGSNGWVQSQLAMEEYAYSNTEVLSPSRVIPAASRAFGTRSTSSDVVDVSPARRGFLLPGGADE